MKSTARTGIFLTTLLILAMLGCGPGGAERGSLPAGESAGQSQQLQAQWPGSLPPDGVQPWERLDAQGHAVADRHGASDAGVGTVFAAGIERFDDSSWGVSDNQGATRLASGDPGKKYSSYAIYRLPLEGAGPGMVGVDANPAPLPNGAPSSYTIGLADYGRGGWEWHGPYTTNHVILSTAQSGGGGQYASTFGNVFVCIVAYNGAKLDVVGVSASPRQQQDTNAPAAPQGLRVRQVAHALELHWDVVAAVDLAGYRVYNSSAPFDSPGTPGVETSPCLTSRAEYILPVLAHLQSQRHVRVSAIDINGNESPLSNEVVASPLGGSAMGLLLAASSPSGRPGDPVALTATGGHYYDWDLDGDGVYEFLDDTTGRAQAETSLAGVLRPAVRGRDSSGTIAALAGVSILLDTNSRPVANAIAVPSSGPRPLSVTLAGVAEDEEDPASELTFAWDFNGDGNFEGGTNTLNPPVHVYDVPGLYNVKLRVEDTQGAWDVDTVAVLVTDGNLPPVAELDSAKPYCDAPGWVLFNANGSHDPDGTITMYEWDFNGDGIYDESGDVAVADAPYNDPGVFRATLRVTDDEGATDTAVLPVHANRPLPTAPGWPMFGRDAQHTRRAPYKGPETSALKWKFRTHGLGMNILDLHIGPDGTVYVRTDYGKLIALNADGSVKWENGETYYSGLAFGSDGTLYASCGRELCVRALNPDGSLKWICPLGWAVESSPAVGPDGTVYVSRYGAVGGLQAIKPDGGLKWFFALDEGGSTPAVAPDGTIYAAAADNLYALTPGGALKWSCPTGGWWTPVIATDGTVYAATPDGIAAVSAAGALLWSYSIPISYTEPVLGLDGTIYFSTQASIHALTPEGNPKWTYDAPAGVTDPVVAPDGKVCFAGGGMLYALDADGHLQWTYASSGGLDGPKPAVNDGGTVFFAGEMGRVSAVSAAGSLQWSYTTGGAVNSSPVVGTDGTVYVGCNDRNLYAINPDGSEDWAFTTGGAIESSPAIGADGSIYASCQDGKLYAISPDGSLNWLYDIGTTLDSSPTIDPSGAILVTSGSGLVSLSSAGDLNWITEEHAWGSPAISSEGTLYAIGGGLLAFSPSGAARWSLGADALPSPAIGTDGTAYFIASGMLMAADPSGALLWQCYIGFGPSSSPAVAADGTIYVGAWGLRAVSPDGEDIWRLDFGSAADSSPAIDAEGTIYLGGYNRRIYAINPDGSVKWSFATDGEVLSSPAIGADGTVYCGSDNGYLYAIGPGSG